MKLIWLSMLCNLAIGLWCVLWPLSPAAIPVGCINLSAALAMLWIVWVDRPGRVR